MAWGLEQRIPINNKFNAINEFKDEAIQKEHDIKTIVRMKQIKTDFNWINFGSCNIVSCVFS